MTTVNEIDFTNSQKINTLTQKISVNPENVLVDAVDYLYKYFKSINVSKITPSNIVFITAEIIQIVEKYDDLTGIQKKHTVINVIKKLVNNQLDTDDDKRAINIIIDLTLPTIIDNLVSAINGEFKFNKEKVTSFFKKIFCCCKSN
jgi:hypothetical protein